MPAKEVLAEASKQEDIDDRCRTILSYMQNADFPYYDRGALKGVTFVSASPGKTEYAFTVGEHQCNGGGNLHGGCAATMLDNLTSTTMVTLDHKHGEYLASVSRTLSCTYLKALPMGEKCTVVSELVRGGRRFVFFKGEIRGSDGKTAVICHHDKVISGPAKL